MTDHRGFQTYFGHAFEELLTTPTFHAPVVIVLFGAAKAKGSIAATAASKVFPSAELHLPVVHTGHLLGDDIPVGLLVEVLGPSASFILASLSFSKLSVLPFIRTLQSYGYFQGSHCVGRLR